MKNDSKTGRAQPRGRILMVAPQPFYEDRGTPIAVRRVIEALSEKNYAIDLLTFPVGEDLEIPGLRIERTGNPLAVRHIPIGLSLRKLFFDTLLVPALAGALRKRRYDMVHAVEEAAFPAAWLCKRKGIPLLYDMQSCLPEQLSVSALFRNGPMMSLLHSCERWLIQSAKSVVCSAGLGGYVLDVHPGASVREWHFPGEQTYISDSDVNTLRHQLSIAPGKKVILYCGNFETYQGVNRLVDAVPSVLTKIPECVFVLVGARNRSEIRQFRGYRQLMQRDALRVIPRKRRCDIPTYLALADLLVAPRNGGGNLPLKIFDYLAAGKPIVATDSTCHRAILNENRASLVPMNPGRPGAFADAIVDLLEDPERCGRLAANAKEYADENLGWVAFVERTARIYEWTIGRAAINEPE